MKKARNFWKMKNGLKVYATTVNWTQQLNTPETLEKQDNHIQTFTRLLIYLGTKTDNMSSGKVACFTKAKQEQSIIELLPHSMIVFISKILMRN
ncbi:MAG: hypothetical protein AB7S72_16235 [Draconibacterium sp.]